MVVLLLSGCGRSGGFNPASQPAKTRFAIAQAVEAQVAAESGAYQGSNELSTVCGTQSADAWFCTSQYADTSGNVTSVDQLVAETRITYKSGVFIMRPAGGTGLSGKISIRSIAKLIRADGNNIGVETQSGALQLTSAELAKQSMSTLQTLLAAAQAAGLNVPSTAAASGNTGPASGEAGASTAATPPTTTTPSSASTSPASIGGLPTGDSASGVAATIAAGPVPDRRTCTQAVLTSLNGGNCSLAEALLRPLQDAYGNNDDRVPARITIQDPSIGADTFACQVLSQAKEVVCNSRRGDAEFWLSDIQGP